MNANGQGTTWKAAGKRRSPWVAVLVVGWTPEGRPIRRSRFAASEREAKAMLADMRRAHQGGRPLPDHRLTVGRWLVDWLEHVRPALRWATIRAYDQAIRSYLLPDLGTLSLLTLAPSRVETTLARMAERGLSPNTCAAARDVLKRALADAVKDGYLERNAAALARPPRQSREQLPAPTTADVRALLAALAAHRLRDMVLVMAATGLRVSEAMGLRWEDCNGLVDALAAGDTRSLEGRGEGVHEGGSQRLDALWGAAPDQRAARTRTHETRSAGDYIQPALTVRFQLAWQDGEAVLAEPKSARSRRTILLPPVAVAALRSQRARQAAERLAAGPKWQDATGLVFLTREGRPLSESTLQWVMSQACKAAGIRHASPHSLRRFAATEVSDKAGKDAAQVLLGHTDSHMTDRYVTATDVPRRRAADAMEGALG